MNAGTVRVASRALSTQASKKLPPPQLLELLVCPLTKVRAVDYEEEDEDGDKEEKEEEKCIPFCSCHISGFTFSL